MVERGGERDVYREGLRAVGFTSYPRFQSRHFLSWSERDGEKSVQLLKLNFLLLLLIDALLFIFLTCYIFNG